MVRIPASPLFACLVMMVHFYFLLLIVLSSVECLTEMIRIIIVITMIIFIISTKTHLKKPYQMCVCVCVDPHLYLVQRGRTPVHVLPLLKGIHLRKEKIEEV